MGLLDVGAVVEANADHLAGTRDQRTQSNGVDRDCRLMVKRRIA